MSKTMDARKNLTKAQRRFLERSAREHGAFTFSFDEQMVASSLMIMGLLQSVKGESRFFATEAGRAALSEER